jgi:formamidopyrimidine-DNA glycosylase
VVFQLHPDAVLVFRLGMTGQILVTDADQPRDRHVHLRVALDGGERELRFRDVRRFGSVCFTEGACDDSAAGLEDLGPEPLEITASQFTRLLSRPRQIKALLLDQRAIAGLGNIYCDEALHAAGIHPLTRAGDLSPDQRRRLLRAIRRILRQAIRYGGSTLRDYRTATGDEGRFQTRHRVYGRTGQPCRNCGTPIQRLNAAGRSTHLCPACQILTPR